MAMTCMAADTAETTTNPIRVKKRRKTKAREKAGNIDRLKSFIKVSDDLLKEGHQTVPAFLVGPG
jgi:hypothetical protein